MTSTPLNPDALEKAYDVARSHEPSYRARLITVEELSERVIRAYLAFAQPELLANSKPKPNLELVNTPYDLLDTRAGLALASRAFSEGMGDAIDACNKSDEGEPFVRPPNPYSAALLAMIKADRPEVPRA